MKSYKRNEYLKCSTCKKELTEEGVSEDYTCWAGEPVETVEVHECYECYKLFYVQYNKNTDMVDVTK